jgi:hypothetical protein
MSLTTSPGANSWSRGTTQSLNKPSFIAWSTPPAPYRAKRDHLPHVSNAAGALIRHARSVFKVKEGLNGAGRGHGAAHCGEGGARAARQQYGGKEVTTKNSGQPPLTKPLTILSAARIFGSEPP